MEARNKFQNQHVIYSSNCKELEFHLTNLCHTTKTLPFCSSKQWREGQKWIWSPVIHLYKATEIDTSLTSGPQLWEFQTHWLFPVTIYISQNAVLQLTIHKFIDFLDWSYLDGLLNKENRNQHAKKFACNPRKFIDNSASIEYCKKKQQESCPNANPAEVISQISKSNSTT